MSNFDRVPDFRDLIKQVSKDASLKHYENAPLTIEERKELETIERASENAAVPLRMGVSAIGKLLAYAKEDIDHSTINNIGWLIEAMGEQLYTLNESHEYALSILAKDDLIKAKLEQGKAASHE